ncbi:MAG: formylglycine-generating enzyme family protein [Nitrosomonadales bacterium]|nr:formylglycine-generating enzyme family protein [Nitrosomonadales bacterium]
MKRWFFAVGVICVAASWPVLALNAEPVMVRIPGRDFEIGKYEVTQREWRDLMGNNPSMKKCGDNCPVDSVSWNDVQDFIKKLNASTNKRYRLPTEIEWEYACYGGNQSEFCGSANIDTVAWYKGNSDSNTHPVGLKQANGYGLYDMSGNVWEWMQDCSDSKCGNSVLRGGSWYNDPQYMLVTTRYVANTVNRVGFYGFRLARTLP